MLPATALYLPAAHGLQEALPGEEVKPASQKVHSDAPTADMVPAGQASQEAWPKKTIKRPGPQEKQAMAA
jgi:hypothetical protein